MMYTARPQETKRGGKKAILIGIAFCVLAVAAFFAFRYLHPTKKQQAVNHLQFDQSVTESEKKQITDAIASQNKMLTHDVSVSVKTVEKADNENHIVSAYVPVTGVYSSRQKLASNEIASQNVAISKEVNPIIADNIASSISKDRTVTKNGTAPEPSSTNIVFVPVSALGSNQKMLYFNDAYYLDSFTSGGVFRLAVLSGEGQADIAGVSFNTLPTKDTTFKANMTGVTALTRLMMKKLNSVGDPLYFSKMIGPFLKDADLTHVSNEVSFKDNCGYSNVAFCSDPRFIKTLQDSGVDLVELTGNHNNDAGAQYNTETINLYHKLGIKTFGGGLNPEEAKQPYLADVKGSKVAFLGYNYPDSPNGMPIASSEHAGANSFDFDKIKADIEAAKQQSKFVIVDIQFSECYAYPDGFVEFPECNRPIAGQEETFHKVADLGADIVIGTQAHQPQIYEQYNGKPIYYGLGNLYFDQTQWPGTERGIILTHYFNNGKLLQTKLTPTIYDESFQTHQMTDAQSKSFFDYLNSSR